MNEDYCSYELSKALKACGFDEPCDHFYEHSWDPTKARISASGVYGEWDNIDAFKHNFNAIDDNRHKQSFIPYCSAPTLWHAQKWLREKHHISVRVSYIAYHKVWFADWLNLDSGEFDDTDATFATYEEALSDSIETVLELIKKGE